MLVSLQALVQTGFELPCHLPCTVRWLPLRDHFAEERERGGDQLTTSLCHTSTASEPLRLLLRSLLLGLVDRRMGLCTEQYLESPLELFNARCERDLPHV